MLALALTLALSLALALKLPLALTLCLALQAKEESIARWHYNSPFKETRQRQVFPKPLLPGRFQVMILQKDPRLCFNAQGRVVRLLRVVFPLF